MRRRKNQNLKSIGARLEGNKKVYSITAIIYDKRGNILSVGKNSYVKTHPLQAKYAERVGTPGKIFIHAEIDAIVKLRHHKKAHKIVVFRYDEFGAPRNAKPCPICQQAIAATGIKVIEHT
jgi:deoxycytidylate deaminase